MKAPSLLENLFLRILRKEDPAQIGPNQWLAELALKSGGENRTKKQQLKPG